MYRVEQRADGQYVTTGGGEFDRVATAAEIEFWTKIDDLGTQLREAGSMLEVLEAGQ